MVSTGNLPIISGINQNPLSLGTSIVRIIIVVYFSVSFGTAIATGLHVQTFCLMCLFQIPSKHLGPIKQNTFCVDFYKCFDPDASSSFFAGTFTTVPS